MYLQRAYYDAYIQARYIFEVEGKESQVYKLLNDANTGLVDVNQAIDEAMNILQQQDGNATHKTWRLACNELTILLNNTVGAEVIGNQDTSINMDTIDSPISDIQYLETMLANISSLSSTTAQLQAIQDILHWTDPGEGGFYDYLGGDACYNYYTDSEQALSPSPRLDRGEGAMEDPSFYYSPSIAGPSTKSFDPTTKLAWNCFAMVRSMNNKL